MPAREGCLCAVLAACAMLGGVLTSSAAAAPGDATATEIQIAPGMADSMPQQLFASNGLLFFQATTAAAGTELWKSNGGPVGAGTAMLDDDGAAGGIADGTEDSNPSEFAAIGQTVFFAAQEQTVMGDVNRELWKVDPPYTTPVRVKDINTDAATASSFPDSMTAVGTTLFFAADDGVNGDELWKSVPPYDGPNTTLVANINNTAAGADSFPDLLTAVGNKVFFSADDGLSGFELWSSDGSGAGMVKNINMGNAGLDSSDPFELTNVNGTLFFSANNGADGIELWTSESPYNGAATNQVENINPTASSDPRELTNVAGVLAFSADDGPSHGAELWGSASPFNAAATGLIADINPMGSPSDPEDIVDFGGIAYFKANNGSSGDELWRSGGTGPTTTMAANINPSGGSGIADLVTAGGQLFFRASDSITGPELWKSSGTGATLVRDINPMAASSNPSELTDVNGTLFFRATNATTGSELWKATIEPAPPVVTPVTPSPAPATAKKKCKKKKKGKKGAAAAKKKKCKKKKK